MNKLLENTCTKRTSKRSNKGKPPDRYGFENVKSKYMDWMKSYSKYEPNDKNTSEEENTSEDENTSESQNSQESINSLSETPTSYNEVITHPNKEKWLEAMIDELNSINKNNVWTLTTLPTDRKAIGCKWLFTMKYNQTNQTYRYKARLVAQGFSQKFGVDYNQVFAPVAKQCTLRILLSIASHENLHTRHLDVKTAFLYGRLTETIYMKQPPGFEVDGKENDVCLLQRSLYGLKQAPRSWNDRINQTLVELNFERNKADPCLYHQKFTNGDECFLLIYVDDIFITSNSIKRIQEFKTEITRTFEIHDLGEVRCYLGIEITKRDNTYFINQEKYIHKLLKKYNLEDAKTSNIPISQTYGKSNDSILLPNNDIYREMIGSLLYISLNSRPDIAAAVCILSQKISCPTKEDLIELKRILKYLKGTINYQLPMKAEDNNMNLYGYCDANFGEDRSDRKSNSGFIFKYNGGTVNWSCTKQRMVALSSTEAEFIALCEAVKEASWTKNLLHEMNRPQQQKTIIYEDNQSTIKLLQHNRISQRSKHIDIRYHYIRDAMQNEQLEVQYCPTETMMADILTKPLSPKIFMKHCQEMNFVEK